MNCFECQYNQLCKDHNCKCRDMVFKIQANSMVTLTFKATNPFKPKWYQFRLKRWARRYLKGMMNHTLTLGQKAYLEERLLDKLGIFGKQEKIK